MAHARALPFFVTALAPPLSTVLCFFLVLLRNTSLSNFADGLAIGAAHQSRAALLANRLSSCSTARHGLRVGPARSATSPQYPRLGYGLPGGRQLATSAAQASTSPADPRNPSSTETRHPAEPPSQYPAPQHSNGDTSDDGTQGH